MKFEYPIEGGDFDQAGQALSSIKKILNQLNIDPVLVRRIAVAMYEAEVNVVAHAFRGIIKVRINPDRIVVRIEDEGPGIPDNEKAMQEGYSTASDRVREMGFDLDTCKTKKNLDGVGINKPEGLDFIVDFINSNLHELNQ